MSFTEELSNLFTRNDNAATAGRELMPPIDALLYPASGICINCNNKPHCVWIKMDKIHCEHYE